LFVEKGHTSEILFEFGMSIIVQTLTTVLGAGLAIIFTFIINGVGRPMAWFSEPWLIFGLYFCPFLLGCCGSIFYLRFRKVVSQSHTSQLKINEN
jgi:ABC-type polysaccharide/polyol phosphate export permease